MVTYNAVTWLEANGRNKAYYVLDHFSPVDVWSMCPHVASYEPLWPNRAKRASKEPCVQHKRVRDIPPLSCDGLYHCSNIWEAGYHY